LWRTGSWDAQGNWPTGSPITTLAFLCDSNLLVTGGRQIQFWGTASRRRVWTLEVPDPPVRCLGLDADGHELAAADQGKKVLVLDLRDLNGRLKSLGLAVPGMPVK
jgi:hypothetical protein